MNKEVNYINNNVTNYAEHLIDNGLKVGDKIRKNHGGFKVSNEIYEVVEIANGFIHAKCVEVIKPTMTQQKSLKKIIGKELSIEISKGGSFPEYVTFNV